MKDLLSRVSMPMARAWFVALFVSATACQIRPKAQVAADPRRNGSDADPTVHARAAAERSAREWPSFRGVNGSGIAEEQSLPLYFGPSTHRIWKVAVPPGNSSPIVWGERVFVTAIAEGKLVTIGFDCRNGKELWRKIAPADKLEAVHEYNSPAASTPVTDGTRVYAYFGSFGLVAYDLAGHELWERRLPLLPNKYGTASSPILHRGLVILQRDGEGTAAELIAVNANDGQFVWRTKRPGFQSSWSTPVCWEHDGHTDLVVNGALMGAGMVVGYDPETGTRRWAVPGGSFAAITVPVSGAGLLFVPSAGTGDPGDRPQTATWPQFVEEHGGNPAEPLGLQKIPDSESWQLRPEVPKDVPGNYLKVRDLLGWFADLNHDGQITRAEYEGFLARADANANKVLALRPDPQHPSAEMRISWKAIRGVSELPSPLFYRGRLWFVRNGGMVTSFEPQSGKAILDRERLGAGGQYVASPVAADGRIYAINESGVCSVFRAQDHLEILAKNDLGERVLATPAIAHSCLFIRTAAYLYAFGDAAP